MAQSVASLPYQSPHSSPAHSMQRAAPGPSVETIISYLIASKRSLSSIHLVHRATTILSHARSTIESTTTLIAKSSYLRRSLSSQIKILRGVQFELEGASQAIHIDFQAVLDDLDTTNQKLADRIQLLKQTKIEDGFKNRLSSDARTAEESTPKDTLHDFVDDKPVDDLKDAMKLAIDQVQHAQREISRSIRTLEDDLQATNETLIEKAEQLSGTESEIRQPNIPKLLKSLESHAHEMAVCLESLVRHYDLCVTAIKHTEGGGAAMAQSMGSEGIPEDVRVDVFEAPTQPMTEEERTEMLQVLEHDASEVEEVVIEIQDRNGEMEAQLDKIMLWRERSDASYNDIQNAFRLLEKVGTRLSGYVTESARHATRWTDEKSKIEDGIAGMEDLCDMYSNFLYAYDRLIVESARRRTVQKQMERVVQEAHSRLERLYEEDLAERDLFRSEQGDFLPSDIWHGLNSLPPKFVFSRLEGDDAGSVPELPRNTVEEALRRLKAYSRPPEGRA